MGEDYRWEGGFVRAVGKGRRARRTVQRKDGPEGPHGPPGSCGDASVVRDPVRAIGAPCPFQSPIASKQPPSPCLVGPTHVDTPWGGRGL